MKTTHYKIPKSMIEIINNSYKIKVGIGEYKATFVFGMDLEKQGEAEEIYKALKQGETLSTEDLIKLQEEGYL